MKVTILDDYFDTLRTLPSFAKLNDFEVTIFNDHMEDIPELVDRLMDTDVLVLVRERTSITGELLDQLPNLKMISQRSIYPHVDVEACTRNGVLFCSNMQAPALSYAAAELTFGLILAALRQIPQNMAALQQGTWQFGVGDTLYGKTLGIYSYGRLGSIVAGYGKAFGTRVMVYGGTASCERARQDGFEIAESREQFFSESDIISLHTRLTPETRGMVTAADLALMKPDSLLVNTARAGLIEEYALVNGLNASRPGMAAVDVFEQEPVLNGDHPLLHMPNTVCTPHVGFVTNQEFDIQFSDIYDQVVAYANGDPINVINPEVMASP